MTAAEHLAMIGPPRRRRDPGLETESLVGHIIGPFRVLGYYKPGPATPWWLCECLCCGVQQAHRGNRLRNPKFTAPRCRDCQATKPKRLPVTTKDRSPLAAFPLTEEDRAYLRALAESTPFRYPVRS